MTGAVAGQGTRAFAPGRVNLIGEHTDYNDGLCLPVAIGFGVTVTAAPADDKVIHAHAADLGEEDLFAVREPRPARGWRAFVRGTVAELLRAGHPVRGGSLTIEGSVPRGSGLSSSAALEVSLALALLGHSGASEPDRVALARLCSRVENVWVGAQTGLLDQLAALFGRSGHAVRLDMRSQSITPVPLSLGGWRLVTVDSGVAHTHAGSGYNERRRECESARQMLGVASLRDVGPADVTSLPHPLDRRVRHVIEENVRVDQAVAALQREDLATVGRLLDETHASLRDLYDVSVPAVEETVTRLKTDGAVGARIVGGGFGGSVLGLFPPGAEPPKEALSVEPGPAATLL
jgi:galactokinase